MTTAPYTCEYPFAPGCDRPAFKPETPDTYTHQMLIYCTTHWREALVETLEDNAEWFDRMQRAESELAALRDGLRALLALPVCEVE